MIVKMNLLHIAFFVSCLTSFSSVISLSLDPVASNELEQYIQNDVVISMRHIRPRRKYHIAIEALFMLDFPSLKHKLSFYLNRKKQQVTVDIISNSLTYSNNFEIPFTNETSTIRSLAIHFQGRTLTLYVDCKQSSKHQIEISLNKLHSQMDEPTIKLFRERKYPLYFDGSVEDALSRANCQKGLFRQGNKRLLKNKKSEKEKTKKRDIRDRQDRFEQNLMAKSAIGYDLQKRGDIPITHGDCEDVLTRSLTDLIALVKSLQIEIHHQRQDIKRLNGILENCLDCKRPELTQSSCETDHQCYEGVNCLDTIFGRRCGPCPLDFKGNGQMCTPIQKCTIHNCFAGTKCYETVDGPQCGPCPTGYVGDGKYCKYIREACLNESCECQKCE